MRILLWDIDGTLVDTGGAGMRALARAVGASEGAAAALRRMRLGGMTDRRIARILCAAELLRERPGVPIETLEAEVPAAQIDHVLGLYLQALRDSMADAQRFRVLPGVVETMDAIDKLAPQTVHALGTGNLEEGARIKLEHAGLWSRFRLGGYGSDAEERSDILLAALRKASAIAGRALDPADFVVIGDTPRDVMAAHAAGMPCVAVASGGYPVKELAEHSPELVLESLAAEGVAERILECRRRA